MAAEAATPLALYRTGEAGDEAFVYSSWLKSYAKALGGTAGPRAAYFASQHERIERLLARPGTQVLVACDPSDAREVWGYVVLEVRPQGNVVHWAYVKQMFRRFGFGTELLRRAAPVQHSHQTAAGLKLAARFSSTYAPEAAT